MYSYNNNVVDNQDDNMIRYYLFHIIRVTSNRLNTN